MGYRALERIFQEAASLQNASRSRTHAYRRGSHRDDGERGSIRSDRRTSTAVLNRGPAQRSLATLRDSSAFAASPAWLELSHCQRDPPAQHGRRRFDDPTRRAERGLAPLSSGNFHDATFDLSQNRADSFHVQPPPIPEDNGNRRRRDAVRYAPPAFRSTEQRAASREFRCGGNGVV